MCFALLVYRGHRPTFHEYTSHKWRDECSDQGGDECSHPKAKQHSALETFCEQSCPCSSSSPLSPSSLCSHKKASLEKLEGSALMSLMLRCPR